MKYNFNVEQTPTMVSYQPFQEIDEMMEAVVKNRAIVIDVHEHTKQTLSVSVMAGGACLVIAYIPEGCENLKFLTQKQMGVWSGRAYTGNYFKVLKSQGWKEFRFYLEKVLDSLHIQNWADRFNAGMIEELEVTVWMRRSIRMRLGELTIMETPTVPA